MDAMMDRRGRERSRSAAGKVFAVFLMLMAATHPSGQIGPSSGEGLIPTFEGWEENTDGTFSLVFGYFNRNWNEEFDIPVGPGNNLEPGGPGQGQPTHFFPRRNRFVFRIKVPKDFGRKEVVWTLVARGKTQRAYGSLRPGYITDPQLQQFDVGDFGHNNKRLRANKAPNVAVEGALHRTVPVGQPLMLTARATDDGIPPVSPAPEAAVGRYGAWGLRVAWFVYRGPATEVAFEPEQFKVYPDYRSHSPWTPGWEPPPVPADARFPVKVTFRTAGTFVVRVMAHDGGLDSTQDVTVTVSASSTDSAR